MTTFLVGVAVSIVTSVLVNEFCDISPWLAQKLINYAARTWAGTDRDQAAAYEEEWSAVIADVPGKVTKLIHALRFVAGAVGRQQSRRLAQIALRAESANIAFIKSAARTLQLWMVTAQIFQSLIVAFIAPFRATDEASPFFRLAGRKPGAGYWCRGPERERHLPVPVDVRGARDAHAPRIGPCGVCQSTGVLFTTPNKQARIERPPTR